MPFSALCLEGFILSPECLFPLISWVFPSLPERCHTFSFPERLLPLALWFSLHSWKDVILCLCREAFLFWTVLEYKSLPLSSSIVYWHPYISTIYDAVTVDPPAAEVPALAAACACACCWTLAAVVHETIDPMPSSSTVP